jgi:predicted nucleic-acid-binding Zn-ribbon protein
MSEPQPTQCPKCGSREREYGRLYGFGCTRFLPNGLFRWYKRVIGIACLHCGNIELVLEGIPIARAAAKEPERPAAEHPSLWPKHDG